MSRFLPAIAAALLALTSPAMASQLTRFDFEDGALQGWGHINVDDIRELTPAEEAAPAKEAAEKANRYEAWLKSIDAPAKRIVYSGRALTDIAFPLGGIGGGHVSIRGDGAIRQWCIFNRVNERCVVPMSFFAIWAKAASK